MVGLHREFLLRPVAFVLLVIAVVTGVTIGSERAAASHTKIVFSSSALSADQEAVIFLVEGGVPRTIYVWAVDADDPTGVSAFEVNVAYHPDIVTVLDITEDATWLTSGARGQGSMLYCNPSFIEPMPGDGKRWRANASCITQDPATVPGVTGTGLLASITLQAAPGAAVGTYTDVLGLDFTDGTFLVNTQVNPGPFRIPAQLMDASVLIAPFADFNADCAVSLTDVLLLINRFGESAGSPNWDPIYDLNGDNSIALIDVLIIVGEFGTTAGEVGLTC
jgi:hypothetical protein